MNGKIISVFRDVKTPYYAMNNRITCTVKGKHRLAFVPHRYLSQAPLAYRGFKRRSSNDDVLKCCSKKSRSFEDDICFQISIQNETELFSLKWWQTRLNIDKKSEQAHLICGDVDNQPFQENDRHVKAGHIKNGENCQQRDATCFITVLMKENSLMDSKGFIHSR